MNPDAYGLILIASLAGAISGVLVMWNRKASQTAGPNRLRRWTVLVAGTAASACAVWAFTQAFHEQPSIYAAMVVISTTGWVAVLQAAVRLPMPGLLLRVPAAEFALLRCPWIGVRLFGACLRRTPLRHLGGRVFLAEAGQDPQSVLRGIHDAETVHVWALLVSCPWLAFWGLQSRWMPLLVALAVHLPLNVYPILHLRYVSGRLERYLAKTLHRLSSTAFWSANSTH